MPVIQIYRNRLEKLLPNHSYKEILEYLPYIGVDIEEVTDDYVRIEYSPNRPDFSTDYGVAKALRGLFGDELGIDFWEPKESGEAKVYVDKEVSSVRPYVMIFLARNLSLDDETIRQMISMQEDLHNGIGRGRKKLAIGLHDSSVVNFPLKYTLVGREHRFVPLNMDKEVTVEEMLKVTEQGIKYGGLIQGDKYPAILDSKGLTLSIPPIINGNYTRVSEKTRELLVDITGTDIKSMKLAASVISETLHEMGAEIISGRSIYPDGREEKSPDVSPFKMEVDKKTIEELLGMSLTVEEIIESLRKSRLEAEEKNGMIEVTVPHYRGDILHKVDLAEEVLLGYGLFRVSPDLNIKFSEGKLLNSSKLDDVVRSALVGLGFAEVLNPMLVSEEELKNVLGEDLPIITTEFSKSSEHNALRPKLFPRCLRVLSLNQNEPMPRKIFEVGDAVYLEEGQAVQEEKLCFAEEKDGASLTDSKSYLEALIRSLGLDASKLSFRRSSKRYALRSFDVYYENKLIGETFEVHPAILEDYKIKNPVIVVEISLKEAYSFVLA